MSWLKILSFAFKHRDTIVQLVWDREAEARERERLSRLNNLNLCYEHRQERNHARYAPENCDYCKALRRIETLENAVIKPYTVHTAGRRGGETCIHDTPLDRLCEDCNQVQT